MANIEPKHFVNIPTFRQMLDERRKMQANAQRQALNQGRFDAELTFAHLAQKMKQFQEGLDEEHEVGLHLANFSAQIHIREIGFHNPNLIEFRGVDGDGNQIELIQHVSQLSFIFRAIKAMDEGSPYRIGFIQDEEDPAEDDQPQEADTPDQQA